MSSTKDQEKDLLDRIEADPADTLARRGYADWLGQQGCPANAMTQFAIADAVEAAMSRLTPAPAAERARPNCGFPVRFEEGHIVVGRLQVLAPNAPSVYGTRIILDGQEVKWAQGITLRCHVDTGVWYCLLNLLPHDKPMLEPHTLLGFPHVTPQESASVVPPVGSPYPRR